MPPKPQHPITSRELLQPERVILPGSTINNSPSVSTHPIQKVGWLTLFDGLKLTYYI